MEGRLPTADRGNLLNTGSRVFSLSYFAGVVRVILGFHGLGVPFFLPLC